MDAGDKMKNSTNIQDCIIFMTAYRINEYKKNKFSFRKTKFTKDILERFHIESIAIGSHIVTQKGILKCEKVFDSQKQLTQFEFKTNRKEESLDDYKNEIDNISWMIRISHSIEVLLNSNAFIATSYITMEPFLITIDNRVLQVDSVAFFLNDLLFVNYELIDYETGVSLEKDEILGRSNNFNILLTEKIRYFNENDFTDKNDKISDIIFYNISSFFEYLSNNKLKYEEFSYIHNIFVMTAQLDNLRKYFLDVLGANDLEIELKNINNNYAYEYYSQEYLGVVTNIDSNCEQQALFDCQLLEAMKMYFLLNQIVNHDIISDLTTTIDRQLEIERLMYLRRIPIITINAIENMKQTNSFRLYDKAIEFKMSYLKFYQDKQRNRNALLLNILLYVLTFMSGIGSIPILQNVFGIPTKPCFIALSIIFVIFGMVWVRYEIKK